MQALLEYRETALRIRNEGLEDRLYMPSVKEFDPVCGTSYCLMGWRAHWDDSVPEETILSSVVEKWYWDDDVSSQATLARDTNLKSDTNFKVWSILFGQEQQSGPEGLQILINRINWFIRRKERWEAYSKLPDMSKKERWVEYERLAA